MIALIHNAVRGSYHTMIAQCIAYETEEESMHTENKIREGRGGEVWLKERQEDKVDTHTHTQTPATYREGYISWYELHCRRWLRRTVTNHASLMLLRHE